MDPGIKKIPCQGYCLQLTGTRILVVKMLFEGCFIPLGARMAVVMISTTDPIVRGMQRRGAK